MGQNVDSCVMAYKLRPKVSYSHLVDIAVPLSDDEIHLLIFWYPVHTLIEWYRITCCTSYHIHQLLMEIWSKSKAWQICALDCSTGESLRNTTVRKHCSKCRWDIIATVEGIMAHNDLQCPQYLCSDDVTSDNSSIKGCMWCWWQCAAAGVWTVGWQRNL